MSYFSTFKAPVTLVGNGRVYYTAWINPGAVRAPDTKPAAFVEHGIAGAWEFSDSTDDTLVGQLRLPQDMDRTDAPQFKIGWDAPVAEGGEGTTHGIWQLEYRYVTQNGDTTGTALETLSGTTVTGTVADTLNITTITGIDTPADADQLMQFRVKRLGASDTLGTVAFLNGMGLRYTKDKLGVAL